MGNRTSGDKPDRSTQHLANERTFLAWLRTSIVIIGLGFVIAKFDLLTEELGLIIKGTSDVESASGASATVLIGIGVIAFGVAIILYAIRNYLNAHRAIESGRYAPKHSIIYFAGIGIVVFGLSIIAYMIMILV